MWATEPARAQTTDDVGRLWGQIERNEELLAQAKELVAETNSIKARASLEIAAKLHQESKAQFGQGTGGSLARAGTLAQKAREVILQTIAMAKREAKLEESAHKAIERATRRLEQGKQLVQNSSNDQVAPRKLLEEAHGQLQRSRDNMREHLYEVALRLAVSSADLSMRAINLVKRDVTDTELIQRELEKTDRVIERFREQIGDGDNPQAYRMLQEATDLQRKAKGNTANGKPRIALELTHKARNIATRGLRLLASRVNAENVVRALRLTDGLLEQAKEIAGERDSDRLAARIEVAARIQAEARVQFEKGNYETALRMTLRARTQLKEGLGATARDLDEGDVEAALQETNGILERAGEEINNSGNELAEDVFARAQAKQERAWEAFRQGQLRSALANTRLARNLAKRAIALLQGNEI
jgi:hypothetical protein